MSVLKFEFTVDTTSGEFTITNTETGEVKSVTAPKTKKTSTKKPKVEESSEPQLILEDNKYSLNTAARELMSVEADDRIAIKYKKINKVMTPVIGTDDVWGTSTGNRLTKTGTVSMRGKGHDDLAHYGTVFTLVENADPAGTFILTTDKSNTPTFDEPEDDNVDIVDEDLINDIESLGGEAPEENAEAIDSNAFEAMLNNI